ncbi:MAG: hypothetical protein Q8830_02240 [Candidatus Phytoplasma australasiaticum]|nr:hypothetical protein [Candidatus Phytoplasma australasiaticum]
MVKLRVINHYFIISSAFISLIDFMIKYLYHIFGFLYFLGKYFWLLFKKIFKKA